MKSKFLVLCAVIVLLFSACNSPVSDDPIDPVVIDAPYISSISATNDGIKLDWYLGLDSYTVNIYRAESEGSECTHYTTLYGHNYTYTDTNVTAGTTYYYQLEYVNIDGIYSEKSTISSITASVESVLNLTITPSYDGLTLNWDAVADADGYEVFRGNYDWDMTLYDTVTTNTLYVTDSDNYNFEVRAYAGDEKGEFSNAVSGQKIIASAATGFTATATDFTKIDLSWNAVDGAVSYNIYRYNWDYTPGSHTTPYATGITTTTYSDSNLPDEDVLYYWVEAVTAGGNKGSISSSASATLLPVPAPTGVSVIQTAAQDGFVLTWDESSVEGITFAVRHGFQDSVAVTTNTITLYGDDTGDPLIPGDTSFFNVSAKYKNGRYSSSVEVTGWILNTPRIPSYAAMADAAGVKLSWDKPPVSGIDMVITRTNPLDALDIETITAPGIDEECIDTTAVVNTEYEYSFMYKQGSYESGSVTHTYTLVPEMLGCGSDKQASPDSITLYWDDLAYVDGYNVYDSHRDYGNLLYSIDVDGYYSASKVKFEDGKVFFTDSSLSQGYSARYYVYLVVDGVEGNYSIIDGATWGAVPLDGYTYAKPAISRDFDTTLKYHFDISFTEYAYADYYKVYYFIDQNDDGVQGVGEYGAYVLDADGRETHIERNIVLDPLLGFYGKYHFRYTAYREYEGSTYQATDSRWSDPVEHLSD